MGGKGKNVYGALRILRICVALLIFCLISAQFMDIYHRLPEIYYTLHPTETQFATAFLNIMATGAVLSGVAFVTFLIITLLFGRAYCSFFCPLGIMMDILRRAAKFPANNRFLKKTRLGDFCKKRFVKLEYAKPRNFLRAVFTGLAILSIIFGYTALFGLIEPYSLYGKIMAATVHLGLAEAANSISVTLAQHGIYSVHPVNGDVSVALAAFGFSIFALVCITVASALRGRLYCNTVCPVGGFLGALAKFSIFQLTLNSQSCISCGKCARVCKAQCIDSKNKNMDFSRCVLCFNCIGHCPKSSLSFSVNKIYKGKKSAAEKPKNNADITRRDFVKSGSVFASLLCAGSTSGTSENSQEFPVLPNASPFPARGHRPDKRLAVPPGAVSVENFLTKCTACQICVATCPSRLLKPSITEWGLSGFMQPYMDFLSGFCVHECNVCSKVCPTGAIQAIPTEEKLTKRIGVAVFIKNLCIVETDGTDCAACAEHCPVSAIEMIPHKPEKSLYLPHVHSNVCIGCGACEHICPIAKNKAIVVQGLAVHETATPFDAKMRLFVPQETKPTEAPKPLDNPFPF